MSLSYRACWFPNREDRGHCSLESCLHCACSQASKIRDFASLCKEHNKRPKFLLLAVPQMLIFLRPGLGVRWTHQGGQGAAGKDLARVLSTSLSLASSRAPQSLKLSLESPSRRGKYGKETVWAHDLGQSPR